MKCLKLQFLQCQLKAFSTSWAIHPQAEVKMFNLTAMKSRFRDGTEYSVRVYALFPT